MEHSIIAGCAPKTANLSASTCQDFHKFGKATFTWLIFFMIHIFAICHLLTILSLLLMITYIAATLHSRSSHLSTLSRASTQSITR